MKSLVLASLLFGSSIASALANDVLQNGNFADGLSHWNGDATGANAGSGASVTLRQDDWSKLTQVFDAPKGRYTVSITFLLTPGSAFAGAEKDYKKVPKKLGYTALKEFRLKRGEFCFIVTDEKRFAYCGVKPLRNDSASQTVTGELALDWPANQQTLCVAFPPGNGAITVQSVSMTSR